MRASSKTYEEVAKNCSSFTPKTGENESYSNTLSDTAKVSCTNCRHFTDEKYCELDLYDQIVDNKNL